MLVGVLAVFLISLWTLFGLSSVSVEYNTTTKNLSATEQEIVKAGEFKNHSCVLFAKKKNNINKIYAHTKDNENFAYIKILNIETKFPNKYVIHVAERKELYAIKIDSTFYILDDEFRVLRIADTFASTEKNAILLEGLDVKNSTIKVGDFLSVGQAGMKNLYSAFVRNNRSFAEQIGKFEKMGLSVYEDEFTHKEYTALALTTFAGRKFVINNIDFALSEKLQKMYAVESMLYSMPTNTDGKFVDKDGNVIYVVKLDTNEYVAFDSEKHEESQKIAFGIDILQNCYIKIDNLTLAKYVNRNTKDIYYSIIEN